MQIDTALNACLTITFLNKTHTKPTPIVWVCANRPAYDRSLAELQELNHIEVIEHGLTHIVK